MFSSVPFIQAKQVHKSVSTADGPLTILQDIQLNINQGESVALVGSSGSGKSTLLGLLAGLDTPTRGEIVLAGYRIDHVDDDERARIRAQHVGFVFQQFLLLPALTALENVALPAELAGQTQARQRAIELLQEVGLGQRMHFFPSQLSGGEQQRVAIARAFMTAPKILFADEPSANLDSQTGRRVEDLLFEMNRTQGTTLVLVTHNPALAARCQQQYQLNNGVLVQISAVNTAIEPTGHSYVG
jgi:putative ABC transport system ATP-binding protein